MNALLLEVSMIFNRSTIWGSYFDEIAQINIEEYVSVENKMQCKLILKAAYSV
jgi:hypothetical protein